MEEQTAWVASSIMDQINEFDKLLRYYKKNTPSFIQFGVEGFVSKPFKTHEHLGQKIRTAIKEEREKLVKQLAKL